MKALDIYRNGCWSFDAENAAVLNELRCAMVETIETAREQRLARIRGGRCYRFVGSALNLDLAADFFDEVIVRYAPTDMERGSLEQRVRRWKKQDGRYFIPERRATDCTVRRNSGRWRQFPSLLRSLWSTSPAALAGQ